MRKVFVASLLLAGLVAPALHAQSLRFGLGPGVTMPMGDYGDADKLGFHGLGLVQVSLPGAPVQLRGDVMYSTSSHKNNIDGHTNLIGGTVGVVYPFGLPAAPVRPYLTGGIGYYNVKMTVTGFPDVSESKIGFGGGVGVLFGLGGMHAFAEARYMSVSTTGGATAFVPVTVGLMFGN